MAAFRLCFFLILFIPALLFAQASVFRFENISTKQTLSHNTVTSLIRDSDGFLWIATVDGLNRYDGFTCKTFKHNPKKQSSISVNFLHKIIEDSRGFLWIATRDGGLNKFDKRTEKFTQFRHDPKNTLSISSDKINDLVEDKSGNLWLATEAGLNKFNPDGGTFKHFVHYPDDSLSLSNNWLNAIILDSNENLWISSLNGLNRFNLKSGIITRFFKGNDKRSLSHKVTTALYEDKEGLIWVGTAGGGLHSYDKQTGFFTNYAKEMAGDLGAVPVNINSIVSYGSRHLLIATEGYGILLFDKKEKKFTAYMHDPENTISISSNIVNTIVKDRQGIIWLGTWGGGVDKLSTTKKGFRHYNPLSINSRFSTSNSVFSIAKGTKDVIWFGTKAKVLNVWDRKTNNISIIPLPTSNSSSPSGVGALHLDVTGNLWIGYDGLLRYNIDSGSFKHFLHDPLNNNSISGNDIKCIVEDGSNNLWIGTEDGGASKYNKSTGAWSRYFHKGEKPLLVRTILPDSQGNIWFGTYKNGIIRMDATSGDTTNFVYNEKDPFTISNNDIRHIIETKNNEIWVATYGGGINKFDKKSGQFTAIKEADGLSNNFTYGILEDDNENLWISTNYGLTKYDRENNSFKVYTQEVGLQNNEFNTGAFLKAADGELFFGGIEGFNSFFPGQLRNNEHKPPIYLTSFRIFDKDVLLDTSITYKSNIELSYSDKFFAFEFAALDFINPAANNYAYKLEGFDREWIKSSSRRFASYTNLDPGSYTLRVKASNNDGYWNEEGLSLGIIVSPPYWQTTWFRGVTSLVLLGFIIATVRYYSTRRLKRKILVLEREQVVRKERERISRDLHDNVGAHLTFLISSIDNLSYTKNDQALTGRIGEISNYGRKTIKELRNTIWAMKYDQADLHELILKLHELRQEVNSSFGNGYLNITNNIKTPLKLSVPLALNIFRIVQEAIQNTIKYAEASHVEVRFYDHKSGIQLEIMDNGNGFDTSCPPTGNGLANMKTRCEEVNGTFIIESNDKGTVIKCMFPK